MSQQLGKKCTCCLRGVTGTGILYTSTPGIGRIYAKEWRRKIHYAGKRQSLSFAISGPIVQSRVGLPQSHGVRWLATASEALALRERSDKDFTATSGGPLHKYDERVDAGLLRDDSHQRGVPTHVKSF